MSSPRLNGPIPVTRPWLPPFDAFESAARDIFERRFVSNFSKYSSLLEEQAGLVFGCPAIAVTSCDIGMTLAWKALGVGPGEVIVPSFTFASTVNAIVWNGLTPVFADIDPITLCLDPESVEKLISPQTVGIAAVHVFGQPVSTMIDALAQKRGLTLLFDAAHGIGTTDGGLALATRGDASVFSLSGTKVVTAGEGGLASFRDSKVAERFRRLRGYGFIADYNVTSPGLNGKMSELDAALGFLSFQMLNEMVLRRQEIATLYRARLAGRHGIQMQPEPSGGDLRSYKDLVVLFPSAEVRRAVEQALTMQQIGTKRYFLPVHTMDAYRHLATGALPVTEDVWERSLCLPIFHDLHDVQVDAIIDVVDRAMSGDPR